MDIKQLMIIEDLMTWVVIGTVTGWLRHLLFRGHGFGLFANIVAGIAGAINAGWILKHSGVVLWPGFRPSIVNGVIGATILLIVIGFI
ncbi:MAG TPA: GlsB/YeaQ/YmgE family stress response membrane protein [Xanthobacteraceae bacterium]|nr:GlsB/YeaQ/YmgE family stress response membrane protein [Hyphomicrobiaceae bacterium]HKD26475.1 GlsB/YeaQ/YmgE family stress response membrane protein [Xanthobacteraceae bacterium]